jgi:voltage-gated potassium channel Kch
MSGLRAALGDARVRWLGGITGTLVASATVIFKYLEGWTWVDALFFAVVTISTVGYGDMVPQTVPGRLLAVVYIILGIGVFIAAATALGDQLLRRAQEIDRNDGRPVPYNEEDEK